MRKTEGLYCLFGSGSSGLGTQKEEADTQAAIIAEKIRFALQTPYLLNIGREVGSAAEIEHHCTASIGVAIFIGSEVSQVEILKCADVAMYKARKTRIKSMNLPTCTGAQMLWAGSRYNNEPT